MRVGAEESTRVDNDEAVHIEGQMGFMEAAPEAGEDGIIWKGAELLREHLVPIGELRPNPLNPRRGDVESIAMSLARFGQVRPVLTDPGGEIVAGHHVTLAAKDNGWTHVAAVPATFDTDEEKHAYLLADNQLSHRGYELLKEKLALVKQQTVLDGTGFSEDKVKLMELAVEQYSEEVELAGLKRHEMDARELTDEQRRHLTAHLREVGLFKQVQVARDGTVLAGREVIEAALEVGFTKLPVNRLDIDPDSPEALRIMAADSEIAKIGKLDDRKLTDLLKEIKDTGDVEALVGTGHTAETLAAMVMVTRDKSEIEDVNHAAEWVGLPEWNTEGVACQVVVSFEDEAARDDLMERLGVTAHYKRQKVWSIWWPPRDREKPKNLRFEG